MEERPSALAAASDDRLMALYADGDRHAARELTARVLPRLVGYAARLLSGDRVEAEDVAQEVMMRLWRLAPDWRPGEARVSTWAYRVATNLCIDRRRRGFRQGANAGDAALADVQDPAAPVVEGLVAAERLLALTRALDGLPDRQRQAVVLRHIEGMANPQIAEVMDMSIEAVESLTARGKRALVEALAGKRQQLGYHDDR
jgi:RNA polymerase sigma factor (sigma-70 family)